AFRPACLALPRADVAVAGRADHGPGAARTELARRAQEDVGEQIHRDAHRPALKVGGPAGDLRAAETVDEADRNAGGEERQRRAEGAAVHLVRRRLVLRAPGRRARVAAGEAHPDLRAEHDREVVRRAGPAVVQVGALAGDREHELARPAARVGRALRRADVRYTAQRQA